MITLKEILKPELIYGKKKIVKAACGYKHTILLTESGELLCLGNNKFGQCGLNSLTHPDVTKIT